MAKFQPKQIAQFFHVLIRVGAQAYASAAASTIVTTSITTALGTAGRGGVSVPVQITAADTTVGIITTTTKNRVEIYDSTTKQKYKSLNGDEVYARLTEAAGVYTLTYYTQVAGVETAYTFPAVAGSIDFEFSYNFDFDRIPVDAMTGIQTRNVSEDPAGGGALVFREALTPTGVNTIPAATKTPISAARSQLIVNGKTESSFSGAFTVAAKVFTWVPGSAGYNLATTDEVVAEYATNE
jgi:hypothetical protein